MSPTQLIDGVRSMQRERRLLLSFQYVVVDCVLIITGIPSTCPIRLLTILFAVKEGRNFGGDVALDEQPRLRAPSPYINIFVNPDSSGLNKFKTQVQARTENPTFSEHFKL